MIETRIIEVTPELAKAMLQKNNQNRGVSQQKVAAYAEDMQCGNWQMNGEAIVFDEHGNLKNGQHRLLAVIKANTTVKMLIVYGVNDDVMIFDRGRGRTVADTLRISGFYVSDKTIISTAILDVIIRKGQKAAHKMTDIHIREWIETNHNEIEIVRSICGTGTCASAGRISTKCAPMYVACYYALKSGVDADVLREFFKSVRTGIIANEKQSPAIVLRNDIMSKRISPSTRQLREICTAAAERAIYDYAHSIPRKLTYCRTSGHVFLMDKGLLNEKEC